MSGPADPPSGSADEPKANRPPERSAEPSAESPAGSSTDPSADPPTGPAAPYFDQTRPLPPTEPVPGQQPYAYAVQDLTEQQVDRRRRHTGLYAAIAVVIVGVLIVAVVFLVNRNGHGDRSAYCDKLRSVTGNGDLGGALGQADPADLDTLAKLAPDPVSAPWADLVKLRDSLQGGGSLKDVNVAKIGNDVATIVSDAKSGCGITIDLPLGGGFSTS